MMQCGGNFPFHRAGYLSRFPLFFRPEMGGMVDFLCIQDNHKYSARILLMFV